MLIPIRDLILASEFEVTVIFELILNRFCVHKTGILQLFYYTGTGSSMLNNIPFNQNSTVE